MAELPTRGPSLLKLTAELVGAYVSRNHLSPSDLPQLVVAVHSTLQGLGNKPEPVGIKASPLPAVSIRKSVTPDHLVCLDDGLRFKSLKRHLASLGMTPEQYRQKWNLPSDYPMVAANYSISRSQIAKSLGLGRKAAPKTLTPVAPVRPISRQRAKKQA